MTNPTEGGPPPLQRAVEKLKARTDDCWPGLLLVGQVLHRAAIDGA